MLFIRSRTRDFAAGVNWTLCAREAPHKIRTRIWKIRAFPRMVRLSYTAAGAHSTTPLFSGISSHVLAGRQECPDENRTNKIRSSGDGDIIGAVFEDKRDVCVYCLSREKA
jgi:hypothetical protein